MLDKFPIHDQQIIHILLTQYNVAVKKLEFLPVGNDLNTAAYRAHSTNGKSFFLKIRRSDFNKLSVAIPELLHDKGINQVIAPLLTIHNELWVKYGQYYFALYPFIEGKNGFITQLSELHWKKFGTTLKALHDLNVPQELKEFIFVEDFSPKWRISVKKYLEKINNNSFSELISAGFADYLKSKQEVIQQLLERAEKLAPLLQKQNLKFVLCHADIHAANVMIDSNNNFYIVDWDTLLFAPKERDLMFIGAGIGGNWNKPEDEILFFQGYGGIKINSDALSYYRCERIIEDIAVNCEQIFESNERPQDRERMAKNFSNQFEPNNVVDIALRTDALYH